MLANSAALRYCQHVLDEQFIDSVLTQLLRQRETRSSSRYGVPERDIPMETIKVRELGDAQLRDEVRKAAELLFRIRFQLKLGQKDGVKRLQELKKDVARFKTIERERVLSSRKAATPTLTMTSKNKERKASTDASKVG